MFYLNLLRENRFRKKIEENLIDGFSMMANAMKSGLSLPQSLQMVAKEGPEPLNQEIGSALERMKLGVSLEEALVVSEKKIKSSDFSLMVHSILILRQIGGNFVVHFEKLTKILRERERVSQKIRVLTAQGLSQGVILGMLPIVLGLGLWFLSPEYIAPLWESPLGWFIIILIFSLDLGGYLWMRKMAKVEI